MTFAGGPAKAVPTCYVAKGKDKYLVNIADVPEWEEKGFKRVDAPISAAAPVSAPEANEDEEPELTLSELAAKLNSNEKLNSFIEEHGLDVEFEEGAKFGEKKEALIEYLESEG